MWPITNIGGEQGDRYWSGQKETNKQKMW